MKIYSDETLTRLLDDFCTLTGLRNAILDLDFNLITSGGGRSELCAELMAHPVAGEHCRKCTQLKLEKCAQKDEMLIHTCPYGIVEVISPLKENGTTIGYVISGKMTNVQDREAFVADVAARCKPFGITTAQVPKLMENIHYYPEALMESTKEIINAIWTYVLAHRLVYVEDKPMAMRVMEYIDSHLALDLSVSGICALFNVSKTELYSRLKPYMPQGIAAYIKEKRLDRAKTIFQKYPERPAWRVAEEVGFSHYAYFLRSFKKYTGMSARAYANQNIQIGE